MESAVGSYSKIKFWKNKIDGAVKTSPYGIISEDNAIKPEIRNLQIEVSKSFSEKLIILAKGKHINVYKLFMAGLTIALSKYSVYRDLLITTSSFNFETHGFVNNAALLFFRLIINEEDTVKELLNKIHTELTDNLNNQDYDYFEFKAKELHKENISDLITGTGLYFDEINTWLSELEKVSCLFKISYNQDKLTLSVDYHKNIYSEKAIAIFGNHVLRVVELLALDFNQKINNLNFITSADKELIISKFNNTKVDYNPITVIKQFEEQAVKTPNAIAVKSGDSKFTYQELNEKANRLANYLLDEYDLKKQERVALMVNRSEKIIIGILGILKAGGVYIPIDISVPKERIDFFLKDSQCVAVLTEDYYMIDEVKRTGPTFISIDSNYSEKCINPELKLKKNDIVYVIYTSGTTGKPKGSMVFHYSLTNHVNWFKKQFELSPSDSTMLINSYSFDGCYSYIWATITSGGVLHIPNDKIFDPDATLNYIKQERITFLKLVPSTFGVLVNSHTFETDSEACKSVRIIKQGGEIINVKNLRKYLHKYPNVILGNHYGATECTIGSVAHWITKDTINEFARQPVLGSPFDNQQIYVLDEKNKLLPIGVFGTICIGGHGVGKGYLNNLELTEKKFINNPFKEKQKLYKTGDQGRWLPNGTLEFVGRLDNQVKIRGYRVELDEISEILKELPIITDAITLVYKEEKQDYLASWFIAEKKLDRTDIETFLKVKLPHYMLPYYYVQLERIPLTSNGKIDKKALPDPKKEQLKKHKKTITPKSETEKTILKIWIDLLESKDISIDDNFFEIGGHSLKATQLVSRMHKHFNVKLPLRDVFFNPTIIALSELIDANNDENNYSDIIQAPIQEHYELSHAQKRMWLTYQIQEDKTVYNIPHVLRLTVKIDKKGLQKSIQALIKRHEILRTIFITVEGEPRQKIIPFAEIDFKLQYYDLRKNYIPEKKAKQIAIEEANTIFYLDEKPPLAAKLLQIADNEYLFLFTLHHIISDGWSTQVFTNELLKNYSTFSQGNSELATPLKIQYKDFAYWQNKLLVEENTNSSREYWMNKFSGEILALDLPIDKPRVKERTYKGATKAILINEDAYHQLTQYTISKDVTLFMALMAYVKILLYRYTGQKDIIVGTPIAGREHADLADQIGFYVNTLAIRSKIKSEFSFDTVLQNIKNNLLDAYEHQIYPFDKLIEDLKLVPEKGRSPLFDVLVVMQNNEQVRNERFEVNNLKVDDFNSSYEISKFDLTFSFTQERSGLNLEIEYSTELFSEAKVERMLNHFQNILRIGVKNPDIKIGEFNYLSKTELNSILSFNGSINNGKSFRSITQLFDEQVRNSPNNIALVDEFTSYTYDELNQKANEIAFYLQVEKNLKKGDIVAVVCDRNADFIISMLGTLKAGGAYLPFELTVPIDRIKNLISYTGVKVVITDSKNIVENLNQEVKSVFIPELKSLIFNFDKDSFSKVKNTSDSLAYIMFTSGTTGMPKGVMVSHKNIIRLVKETNYTSLNNKDRILQTGSLAFDAATFEIWGALLNGGQVHILKFNSLLDVSNLSKSIKEKGITKMWFTSSWFNQLVDINEQLFGSLEQVLVGGEKLSSFHIKKIKTAHPQLKITNCYGPTENTTFSICGDIEKEDLENIPLGFPITNSTVYILDEYLLPTPIGINGELYLGGAGLSKGYISDSEMTAKKFIPSPFAKEQLLYKSGDVGRWFENGKVAFHGRRDEQIKIRGYRIELSEIEAIMQLHEMINEVEVLTKVTEKGEKFLVAYYTTRNELEPDILRAYLKIELPGYMIPKYLIRLGIMPLNVNGKVDRENLPLPDFSNICLHDYKTPSNETEKKLVMLFGELLSIDTDTISVTANFFELGGHSLKAILLASKIIKEFKVDISVKTIFLTDSIIDLAIYIDAAEEMSQTDISKAPKRQFYPVSPAQHRLYAMYQLNPLSLAYNVTGTLKLHSKYSLKKVKNACVKIISRHESLRTSFKMHNQEVYQAIKSEINLEIETFKGYEVEDAMDKFIKVFDLEKGPLIRIGFMKGERASWLLLDMHHIITDGLSQSILIEELLDLLEGKVLEKAQYQYKDYAWWINEPEQKQKTADQEAYWLNRYISNPPELMLPLDFQRPIEQVFEGCTAQFKFSEQNSIFLKKLGKENGTTLYITVLAIWSILLSKLGGVEDLVIGTPVAGRRHPDLMRVVGMFVNTLAIRLMPEGHLNFIEYLKKVKRNCINDFENQDYSFEKLVEKIYTKREISRNPIFDTMYSLLTKEEFKLELDKIDEEIVIEEKKIGTKFDLNFKLVDLEDSIVCNLDYNIKLFHEETIKGILKKFISLVDQLRVNTEIVISKISVISEKEKTELLINVNNTKKVFKNEAKTINQLFEENVKLYPDKIILVDCDVSLTMAKVNEKASQLASFIISKGARANDLIGILLTPSANSIISILGIFKAGCAYLPLDIDLPPDRINHILEDSDIKWLISTPEYTKTLLYNGSIININQLDTYVENNKSISTFNKPENLAYVIYTSGSTGKPKGVPIKQYQLVNYSNWFVDNLNYKHSDSTVLVSSFSFDLGNSAIFPVLIKGGTLHILQKEEYLTVDSLGEYMAKHEITFLKSSPTFFSVIINHPKFKKRWLASVKNLMLGGEAIIVNDLEKVFNYYPEKNVVNSYGPTEATISCIIKKIDKNSFAKFKEEPVIGRPISNMKVYILDTYLNPVSKGTIGQIYLSGIGISSGYLNRPELTSKKFVNNPWTKNEKLYATGDIGSWSSNNEVIFKGRIDDQVKIRGYRVELEEIANVIKSIKTVNNASVLIKEEDNDKMIIAFLEGQKGLDISYVRECIENILPDYMIPSFLIPVDHIPMTPNGKVDKRELLTYLISNESKENSVPPSNEVEANLLKLWSNILGINLNDVNANFFKFGGHSLKALKVINYIEQQWQMKVPLKIFFNNPTVRSLAKYLDTQELQSYKGIEIADIANHYPLSHSQKRLWLLHEFSESKVAYNVPRVYWLNGELNEELLEKSFREIIQKHEILRTIFRLIEGEPRQFILPIDQFPEFFHVEKLNIEGEQLKKFISKKVNKSFDLMNGPLIDVKLYKKNNTETLLILNLHHIISDGWSAGIMLNELCERYNTGIDGENYDIEKLQIQYKDYSVWQNKQFEDKKFLEQHQIFWKNKLSGELIRFSLPETYPRSTKNIIKGKTLTYIIADGFVKKIEEVVVSNQSSLYMILLTALNALFYRYTGQQDIIIGTVIAGREKEELDNQLGFYVNTLAQRTKVKGDQSFEELLISVKNDILETTTYQNYPFDLIVSELNLPQYEGRPPLFDIMYVHQNNEDADDYKLSLKGIEISEVSEDLTESKFDISFVTRKIGENLQIFVEYNANIYNEEFLYRFLKNFEGLLKSVTNNIKQSINEIEYLGSDELKLFKNFNNTFKKKKLGTIQINFEQSVVAWPNNPAIVNNDFILSYNELNEQANKMAWWILEKYPVRKDQLIAFVLERSEWQIITMLAILKTGAGFLPIDVKQPVKRKEFIIKDAAPLFVITDNDDYLKNIPVPVESLSSLKNDLSTYPIINPEGKCESNNIAYVIYTSGSTGKPKGVMIEHQSNINMVADQIRQFKLNSNDRGLQFASISFDASIYEIFISLYTGCALVLLTDEKIANPLQFTKYIKQHKVTFATLPPVYLSSLNKKELTGLKILVTAGEAPNVKDAQYLSSHMNYYNAYGPTEYSVCTTIYKVRGDERVIPIGKPLDNTKVYILDTEMNLLPIGCWGEIHISGAGIARGYIKRPKQNDEKFIENPFNIENKLYKSGDIGRWLEDGNIEFQGRKDNMLKIRGYRVEITEIEYTILEHENTSEAIVKYDKVRQNLIAYVVVVDKNVANHHDLKDFLKERLPTYMLPDFFRFLESIPLTTNGKVDYKLLPDVIDVNKNTKEIILPKDKTEENVLKLWGKILELDVKYISTHDNFFELGGQSILVMKLISSLWENYGEDLSLRDFLNKPTIKGIALQIKNNIIEKGLIIPLNNTGGVHKKTLFMIPPVLGSSSVFRRLASYIEEEGVQCYGIQYRGFDYEEDFDESIQIMAKTTVDEMKPYIVKEEEVLILGYSMGVLIAAETAVLLENEGYKLKLILIDKGPKDILSEIFFKNDELRKEKLINELIDKHVQGFEIPKHNLKRIRNLLRHNIQLLNKYHFNKTLSADILALESKDTQSKDKMLPWNNLTKGKFLHKTIKGNHFTIINENNSLELNQNIKIFINK